MRANYRNVQNGINAEPIFLVRFFRNLLLGETNELKNRYMIINPPEEWKMPDSELVPHKYPTSTPQVQGQFYTDNPNTTSLMLVIGEEELSVKEIMDGLNLKDRKNVLKLYLNPAIVDGYVRLLYPKSPRHPRQKYLLTVKGQRLYQEVRGKM